MAITAGEITQVFGRALVKVGEKLDEGDKVNEITKMELLELLKSAVADAWSEYQD